MKSHLRGYIGVNGCNMLVDGHEYILLERWQYVGERTFSWETLMDFLVKVGLEGKFLVS